MLEQSAFSYSVAPIEPLRPMVLQLGTSACYDSFICADLLTECIVSIISTQLHACSLYAFQRLCIVTAKGEVRWFCTSESSYIPAVRYKGIAIQGNRAYPLLRLSTHAIHHYRSLFVAQTLYRSLTGCTRVRNPPSSGIKCGSVRPGLLSAAGPAARVRGEVSGTRQELNVWADESFLYHCDAKYAQLAGSPCSTIDIAFSPNGLLIASTQ